MRGYVPKSLGARARIGAEQMVLQGKVVLVRLDRIAHETPEGS